MSVSGAIVNQISAELVLHKATYLVQEQYSTPETPIPSEDTTYAFAVTGVMVGLEVSLKDDLNMDTCWLEPGVIDGATTYRVTVNGTNYDATGSTAQELIENLITEYASDIADVTFSLDTESITNVSVPRLKIQGTAITTVAASVSGGTGTWGKKMADAETAVMAIYTKSRRYALKSNTNLDTNGKFTRVETGGNSKLYVRVHTITGDGVMFSGFKYIVRVAIGKTPA